MDISQIQDKLSQTIDNEQNIVDKCSFIQVLRELEHFQMTAQVLTDTRIGRTINNIRKKVTHKPLARALRNLIKKWQGVFGICCFKPNSPNTAGTRTNLPNQKTERESNAIKRKRSIDDASSSHQELSCKRVLLGERVENEMDFTITTDAAHTTSDGERISEEENASPKDPILDYLRNEFPNLARVPDEEMLRLLMEEVFTLINSKSSLSSS